MGQTSVVATSVRTVPLRGRGKCRAARSGRLTISTATEASRPLATQAAARSPRPAQRPKTAGANRRTNRKCNHSIR